MRRRALPFVALALVALLSGAAARAAEFPAPVGRVNDFAALLTPAQRRSLESQLNDLERATSAEVAVVTVRSLDGRGVEEYATALFTQWGIGKKDADNGVLILVAVDDRAMRIEVGYGLEGVLPDGLAGAVIRETFLPRFRDNDYRTGVLEGTARVAGIVGRNETLTAQQRGALDLAASDAGRSWGVAGLLAIFVAMGALLGGAAAGAKVFSELLFGTVVTGLALFFARTEAPRPAILLLALLALGLVVVGFMVGRRPSWRRRYRGTGTGRGGSGWVMSGSGGSDSSGGSSSSGSGSFGGGSSGGGGASGRW